jgi:hypothetical protein
MVGLLMAGVRLRGVFGGSDYWSYSHSEKGRKEESLVSQVLRGAGQDARIVTLALCLDAMRRLIWIVA